MADNLRDTLIERERDKPDPFVGTAAPEKHPTAPTGLPAHTPNETSGSPPPAWQRYITALHMQHAYANGWTPNPMIIRILEGKK